MTRRSRLASTYSSAGFSPSHQVAISGSSSFSPMSRSAIGGRKPEPRGGLEHAGAERIGNHDAAGAQRADEAGHAQRGIAAQFERIAEVVVEAAQDGVHAAQSAERLEEHRVAAHREIVALDQRHAELAREIGVLEIGFVVGAGREDDGERRLVARGVQHLFAQRAEESAHPAHAHVGDGLGMHLLEDLAILERVARAGRRLGAICQQPPAAIRRARQVRGIHVQPGAVGGPQVVAGPEVVRMAERQFGRDVALGQQPLRPIEIGQHAR